ncbi:MAG: FAD-dependent oxidoreductase [Cyanobacteria bacterium P01_D01_bin.128]
MGRFIAGCVLLAAIASSVFNGFSQPQSEISGDRQSSAQSEAAVDAKLSNTLRQDELGEKVTELVDSNGRPRLDPLPPAEEVWECQVVVVGGSLGGIAAAGHAMATGSQTCLIELTPWLGGQVSSQGVPALDESGAMQARQNFSASWRAFKDLVAQQPVAVPPWTGLESPQQSADLNSCWVSGLCFLPRAGAAAAQQWLQAASNRAPNSRWGTSIAFKGASFDASGRQIDAIYAVKRVPKDDTYLPKGRLSQELVSWYSWSSDDTYDKVPIRLQPLPGQSMIVIDATDTGELVGWANIPHRTGSEPKALTGEFNAPDQANPDCNQAYTFPFVMAILDDRGESHSILQQVEPGFSREEHRSRFDLEGFPMFHGGSLFNYRRILSTTGSDSRRGKTAPGDLSIINWNRGNDWVFMDPPLILTEDKIVASGQRQNWLGGLSLESLKEGENHALLFAEWLIETQSQPGLPLTYLAGAGSPLATRSGLSMYPYIREGRRILGRSAYGQETFMILESDIRTDLSKGRDFSPTVVALAHYDVDIHGCRYRNSEITGEAAAASVKEYVVRPLQIPIEALIPIGVDNLLIGGKGIAVSHIANAMTRLHYAEWSIGAAAGATAGWTLNQDVSGLMLPDIVPTERFMPLNEYLMSQGLRFTW